MSVAPFSALAHRYGDDLAIVWRDAHPDVGTPASAHRGFHAMAVAALTGHGDSNLQELLPATVSADRVALVGLHSWAEDGFPIDFAAAAVLFEEALAIGTHSRLVWRAPRGRRADRDTHASVRRPPRNGDDAGVIRNVRRERLVATRRKR